MTTMAKFTSGFSLAKRKPALAAEFGLSAGRIAQIFANQTRKEKACR